MRSSIGWLALSTSLLAACSGSAKSTPPGATSGDGGSPATTPDAGDTGPTAATAGIGPIPVAAGEEKTVCIYKQLGNTEDLVATSFVTDLAPGSHHLIVYRSTQTTENLTPTPCSPFTGILTGDVPILIVTREHLQTDLPSGVGIQLAKQQMLKIEAHYINATATALQGSGNVQVKGTPLAQAGTFQAADVGLWGTTKINVPPQGTFQTPVNFQAGIAGTNIFSLTTHEHRLGSRAQVWASKQAGDTATQVADDKDWSNPAQATFTPVLAQDGTTGLSYQCDWNNTTSSAVQFGESALNEMCFVILYYYPSHGTDLCIDGQCKAR